MSKLHVTHLHLNQASKEAYACYWQDDGSMRDHITKQARKNLVMALAGEPASADHKRCREVLIDLIAMAILGSNDLDVTPEQQAEAVLGDILDNCMPIGEAQ